MEKNVPKTFIARPMTANEFNSAIDIIIPFHGQYEKVTRLLESIFRFTRGIKYRPIVVDDASPNHEYLLALEKYQGITTVRCPEQLGFGGAIKAGFEKSTNPYVLFINSDCVVEDINWLHNLAKALLQLKDQGVRMVAPRTNNPLGNMSLKAEKTDDGENFVFEEGHLPMYCFMCHRQLFDHVGGFIKSYPYGWYEDMEFYHRMKKKGYKQGVAAKSWVYHEGETTIKEVWRRDVSVRAKMESNRELCVADLKSLYGKGH
jgi:GT2 family glycosyltransferase